MVVKKNIKFCGHKAPWPVCVSFSGRFFEKTGFALFSIAFIRSIIAITGYAAISALLPCGLPGVLRKFFGENP